MVVFGLFRSFYQNYSSGAPDSHGLALMNKVTISVIKSNIVIKVKTTSLIIVPPPTTRSGMLGQVF